MSREERHADSFQSTKHGTLARMDTSSNTKPALTRAQRLRGAAMVMAGGICWGFSGTCIQYVTQVENVTVEWASCLRLVISALILVAICLCSTSKRQELGRLLRDKPSRRLMLVYGIFGCFACQITYMEAISFTSAGVATLMEQIGLLIVVFYTCIRQWRAPKKREVVALILALAGVFFICTQGNPGTLSMPFEGLIWGIASMITMATYILIPVKLMDNWSGIVVTAPSIVVAALFACIFLQPWNTPLPITPGSIAGIMGSAVFGVVVAYLLFLNGLKFAGPVVAGLLDCVEPVAALGFSALLLGTAISGFDLLGCLLILSMIVLVTLPDKSG